MGFPEKVVFEEMVGDLEEDFGGGLLVLVLGRALLVGDELVLLEV